MKHRVLILSRHRLFADGLTSLFTQRADIQVVGTIYSAQRLPETMREVKPDVLVVEGGSSPLRCFLCCLAGVRVLVLTMDDNTLDVYEKQHIEAVGPNELLAAIVGAQTDGQSSGLTGPLADGDDYLRR